jgi:hypothetical protein
MVNNKYTKETKDILCIDDIHCKNKRCLKLHSERKRLNVCKFDVFFVPYKDEGCHFEDCFRIHPKRDSFNIKKEKDFDDLILSVINVLELDKDDDIPIIEDWRKLINNIYNTNFNELYNELYTHCANINSLSFQLEALQINQVESYIFYVKNILSNIYNNHQKFNIILKNIVFRYGKFQNQFIGLCNKVNEDIQYVITYKYNTKLMLYQTYGINIDF